MNEQTTLGIKVSVKTKERLQQQAQKLNCTTHWLHKQALNAYLDRLEAGKVPQELKHLISQADDNEDQEADTERDDDTAAVMMPPFFEFAQDVQPQSVLRAAITSAYRRPETECLPFLLEHAALVEPEKTQQLAVKLIRAIKDKKAAGGVESLMQEFSLSSQEGVALMCLAEALLRIPDRATRDALIRDKVSTGDWKSHMGGSPSLFVNAATWGLMITGKLVAINSEQSLSNALARLIGKGGEPLVRKGVDLAMRMLGEQFVAGQTIGEALNNGRSYEAKGFRYSYDMLGEAATTAQDADRYYDDYVQAIHAIGQASGGKGIYEGPGISIKLSALHPRYSRAQRERVMGELLPRVISLAVLAKQYDIGLNIDAEEADRLEISLDILEALCTEPQLAGWNGIGFVIQAYQKRAPYVIAYVIDLGRRTHHRLMIRLVKGAYWDSEIKRAQIDGLEGYPVYTRKTYTDVSYLACARRLLSAPDAIFPQFATHNAQTLSAIYHIAGKNYYSGQYEFQCLHGMGERLYEEVVGSKNLNRPCRVYAPVGSHETLLAYLVRRLLENGANTSFVNQIANPNINPETLAQNPIELASSISPLGAPHDKIPLPRDLYIAGGDTRLNSAGLDLSNEHRLSSLAAALMNSGDVAWQAAPGTLQTWDEERAKPLLNPACHSDVVGQVIESNADEVSVALERASRQFNISQASPIAERVQCLRDAADIMETQTQNLLGLIVREAGKTLSNAIAEVREAIDFLRYYASQAERHFKDGEQRPLGPIVCISPWNFPLAIFTGQVAAALAAGNTVLAKPAEQTPLIAAQAVRILHQAGFAEDAVILLPGQGETTGAQLTAAPEVAGVMFTGSTDVARLIAKTLAQRLNANGRPVPFIAETGGQNAMIVDSSALAEQVVFDVLNSAFDSAGQRCSALRLLCLQEDVADRTLTMIKGAMQELKVGNPNVLAVDVGPVIDIQAQSVINKHIQKMRQANHVITQVKLDGNALQGTFVPPTLIEIDNVAELTQEVFGPVLHVLRYKRANLDDLLMQINATGYGLTFGIHSRIDETVDQVCQRIHAGNVYVNRNIVGATVGVQPFGGQGLSGTGPKAGGPLYLQRLCSKGTEKLPAPFELTQSQDKPQECSLSGPTGENNIYRLIPRGRVLAVSKTAEAMLLQLQQIQSSANTAVVYADRQEIVNTLLDQNNQPFKVEFITQEDLINSPLDAVLFEDDGDALQELNIALSQREGSIVAVHSLTAEERENGAIYPEYSLLHEQSISINTAAAGGNASLMTIG